jgi:hypothetical protein
MGFFDRLANLGKGWVSTKTKGRGDRDAAAELAAAETEREAAPPGATARTSASPDPVATRDRKDAEAHPAAPTGDDEPTGDEPRTRVKKTL